MALAPGSTVITSPAELRELLGTPMRRAVDKERRALHPRDRQWLALSPLVLIATSDADGDCDVSPKGDSSSSRAAARRCGSTAAPACCGTPRSSTR
ncbi:hypothetical protein [Spirillospora albida]|uniref:hypothetical protein n=1 Tax=Spirillospora albida TaxID=58123 RepID=UPI00316ACC0A